MPVIRSPSGGSCAMIAPAGADSEYERSTTFSFGTRSSRVARALGELRACRCDLRADDVRRLDAGRVIARDGEDAARKAHDRGQDEHDDGEAAARH